ncbi:hypothetical protein EVAR_27694_1 [Eumeta japonica]|uniref:Uncharacterized protein n=1 Tax=Eumeta variegata TaxID=151549 RepID=A0A4C1WQF8_EUMVA|nr:hypothetical protein EVAR_27694_1 [Eumeta japonica]
MAPEPGHVRAARPDPDALLAARDGTADDGVSLDNARNRTRHFPLSSISLRYTLNVQSRRAFPSPFLLNISKVKVLSGGSSSRSLYFREPERRGPRVGDKANKCHCGPELPNRGGKCGRRPNEPCAPLALPATRSCRVIRRVIFFTVFPKSNNSLSRRLVLAPRTQDSRRDKSSKGGNRLRGLAPFATYPSFGCGPPLKLQTSSLIIHRHYLAAARGAGGGARSNELRIESARTHSYIICIMPACRGRPSSCQLSRRPSAVRSGVTRDALISVFSSRERRLNTSDVL